MSDMSAGQIVGGIVGAVVGFVGSGYNPMGAVQGFALGAGIGGYIDPPAGPNLRGPTLEDKSFQSSAYGVSIPRLYGTIATMGNIIYLENNQYKVVTQKKQQGGKGGGGGVTVTTERYYATFAVALSEANPNSLVRRIWAGGKLIYSAGSSDFGTILQSELNFGFGHKFINLPNVLNPGWTYYDGTQTEPDSRMEAMLGVGNCPSYEGTAYIIFYDFDLTDYGNGLAGCPIKVELNSGETESRLLNSYDTPSLQRFLGCSAIFFEEDKYCTAGAFGISTASAVGYRGDVFGNDVEYEAVQWWDQDEPGSVPRNIKGVNTECPAWYGYYTGGSSAVSVYCVHGVGIGKIEFFPASEWFLQGVVKVCHVASGLGFAYVRRASSVSLYEYFVVSGGTYISVPRSDYAPFGFTDSRLVIIDSEDVSAGIKPRIVKVYTRSGGAWVLDKSFYVTLPRMDINYPVIFSFGLLYIFGIADHTGVDYWAIDIDQEAIVDSGTVEFNLPYFESEGDLLDEETMWGYRDGVFGVSWRLADESGNNFWCKFAYFVVAGVPVSPVALSDVVSDIFEEAGVVNYDVSELDGSYVDGYRVDGVTSARARVGPLQVANLFDVVERGYQLRCVKRGAAPVANIPYSNLILKNDGIVKFEREQESQLPSLYKISYLDYSREYDPNEQMAPYPSAFTNVRSEQLAIVMTAQKAARLADVLCGLAWVERERGPLSFPQMYLGLNAADIVNVEIRPGVWREFRIDSTAKNLDQTIDVNVRAASSAVYVSSATGAEIDPPSEDINYIGNSYGVLLDIPMVLEQVQDTYGVVSTMYGDGNWPGGALLSSSDSGQTYSTLAAFYGAGTIAVAANPLPVNSGLVIDRNSTLIVSMKSGEFSSITETQMMTGKNYCAYGAHGRWEIIQFANAVLNPNDTITLSVFVRGLFGTEWATGAHLIGDQLILLEDIDNQFIGMPATAVGMESLFKAVTIGGNAADASAFGFYYNAVNLKPLSVVDVRGEREVSDDWVVTFVPRTRYGSNFWLTGNQPINEPVLKFEIDIFRGGVVVRTITVSAGGFTYSSEQQMEDFGYLPSNLFFTIYQISAAVGRGYPRTVAL
ncbi:MAG TPA: phage tail protein [Cellvibrio sp.]|nr:phage tail protein [Cellvibrio sp.]